MMNADDHPLPQRVARADIPNKPPAFSYTAQPWLIVRFLAALRNWDPDCAVEVESVEDPGNPMPTGPLWRLWAWITVRS